MPFDHFSLIAGLYDRSAVFELGEDFLNQLQPSSGLSLLDVGGGTGRVAAALRENFRQVVVMDPSLGMLHYAARKGIPSVRALAEHLPFSAAHFDRIIMVDALHHVLDQVISTQELWRVLRPGGRLLIVEPDVHRFSVKLLALGEKALLMRSHFLSHQRMAALFEVKGSRITTVESDINVMVLVEKVR